MYIPNSCREIFLDGITDIFVYPVRGCSFPIPSFVPNIQMMNGCQLSEPVLHIALSEGSNNHVVASSITAKVSPSDAGNGTQYTYEISCNVNFGGDNVREAAKTIGNKDHFVVLEKKDGTQHLCYSLPGSFSFKTSLSSQQNAETRSVTITTKAMSDLIPIRGK